MYQKHLRILRLVLEATKSGFITWSNDEEDTYYANYADMVSWIRFKYPLLTKDDGSDADIAEVCVGQALMTFYNGCEGYYLVNEILSAAIDEFGQHEQNILKKIDTTIQKLEESQFKNKN